MKIIMAALCLLLAGCTAVNIHQKPPDDWPVLEKKVIHLGFYDTQVACGGNLLTALLGYHKYACVYVNFDTMTCTVYTATDDEYALEHEDTHCRGFEHYGSNVLATYWRAWKAENPEKYQALKTAGKLGQPHAAKWLN